MPKPAWTPIHVEDSTDGSYVRYANGDVKRDIDIHPTPEQYEMMKQGFMCIRCFELQDTAFPETCGLPGCDGYAKGFPMRERQRQVMESEMQDEIRTPPKTTSPYLWTPDSERN